MRFALTFLISTAVLASALVTGSPATRAEALSAGEFNPGYIISDSNFYDANAMSQAQIQAFLVARVGSCQNSNCLAQVTIPTGSRPADAMCRGAYAGSPSEGAAAIIFKVQQACGISAKVLLVTLQKEQGLLTNPAPSTSRLDRAMGYGCPDNPAAPGWCDPAYGGLYNQIYRAAWQFQRYGNPPGTSNHFTWYPVGRASAVRYDVEAACGSSQVVIQNKATAALYYYTPYQPNAAALANLSGTGDGCSSYGNRNFWVYYNSWFGSSTGAIPPMGHVNGVVAVRDGAAVHGWTLDPTTSDSIYVHIYVDGAFKSVVAADIPRPDVLAAYPSHGANHGYSTVVSLPPGGHNVCVYGINVFTNASALLGCQSVVVLGSNNNPVGGINEMNINASRDGLFIRGFVFDADADPSVPTVADVWVNGAFRTGVVANDPRPDVQAAYPGQGPNHGFHAQIALGQGISNVCVYGVNVGGGSTVLLGCRSIENVLPGTNPVGYIDSAIRTGDNATIQGWTFDADSKSPIVVDAWVNGTYRSSVVANQLRPDVKAAYPQQSDSHGFSITTPLAAGNNNICLYGLNVGGGSHTMLGCRSVAQTVNVPIGDVNAVYGISGAIATYGWALDLDTTGPILVDVWINNAYAATLSADRPRSDVAAAYPASGANHGFETSVPTTPGTKNVCLYGIDVGGSNHTLLGCKSVVVS
jgi:hypothetical protein